MGLLSLAERSATEHRGSVQPRGLESREAAGPGDATPPSVTVALQKLVDFVPTETVTLFWIGVPAAQSVAQALLPKGESMKHPNLFDWTMFVVLLVLTPVFLILGYLSLLSSKQLAWPAVRHWPWWKAFASFLAFFAWAFAIPGNPFTQPALLMAVWFGAALLSTLLGLLDPIMTRSSSNP